MYEDLGTNSPVEEIIDALFTERGVRVFVKRDDMIHPFISGNKWRKLKYHLEEARLRDKNHLVTFGGAWSNHLLATACAAAKFNFRSTGFVRGESVDNPVLTLCRIFGMTLHFTEREVYRNKTGLFVRYFSDDTNAMFIDEGGAGEPAVSGCAELIGELDGSFSDICCAAGTGTTAAGILSGLEHKQDKALLHVFPVLKGDFLQTEIERWSKRPFKLHKDYHFGGYAKTTPELIQFIRQFCSSTGMLIEPVYTGKLFYGVYDMIRTGAFEPGSRILLIHSGGMTGILGMMDGFR